MKTNRSTADAVRLELAAFVTKIDGLLDPPMPAAPISTWNGVERRRTGGPAAAAMRRREHSNDAPAPAERPTPHKFEGTGRLYSTERKRLPRDLSPSLRAIMAFLMKHSKPVTDHEVSKKLDLTIAAAHTALWRLRKKRLVALVESKA
jgi:hypothetical protein